MERVGEVQLKKMVDEACETTGLDLTLRGYPVPPHQLYCGDRHIITGTPTEVANGLKSFVAGCISCSEKFAAQSLAQGLTNEPPHVVIEIREPYVVYSNTRGLVAVVIDHNLPPEEGMVEDMNVNPISMIGVMGTKDDGEARRIVCEVLAHRGIHIDP